MSFSIAPTPRLVRSRISAAGSVLGPLLIGESDPRLYPALWDWCVEHDPVPEAIATLVADLHAIDTDSPILARLAAWVNPTPEAMSGLAHWESKWHYLDPRWTKAFLRWMRGEPKTEEDAEILGELLERSPFTAAVQLAMQRHRRQARRALRLACRWTFYHPVERVVLETWCSVFGTAH